MDIYQKNGYDDRDDYLDTLTEQYGEVVITIAEIYGESEDFDGLLTTLEDLGLFD